MTSTTFHSGGSKAELDSKLESYRKNLQKKIGTSFLSSILVTLAMFLKKAGLGRHQYQDYKKNY